VTKIQTILRFLAKSWWIFKKLRKGVELCFKTYFFLQCIIW